MTTSITYLSIYCPTFNHAKFIENALRGFLGQNTCYSYEIVIRDDASTDGTRDIVQKYASNYPRIIRAIYEDVNQWHLRNSWNVMMANCCGKYVSICEGDDYWIDTNKIQSQIDILESDQDCVMTYHAALQVKDDVVVGYRMNGNDAAVEGNKMMRGAYFPTSSTCFRRSEAIDDTYFNMVLNVDTFIWAKLGMVGRARRVAGVRPSVYVEHAGGVWSVLRNREKLLHTAASSYWMGCYFEDRGYNEVAHEHRTRAHYAIEEAASSHESRMWVYCGKSVVRSKRLTELEEGFVGIVHRTMLSLDRFWTQLRRWIGRVSAS